ncbi:MAG: hypothetical protein GVY09_19935 [Gammaproteobacteria bacterium]|jgi:hypothetical protein|nr:hypothetical protein [Gammaproteobacteria bacterium]
MLPVGLVPPAAVQPAAARAEEQEIDRVLAVLARICAGDDAAVANARSDAEPAAGTRAQRACA